MEKKWAQRRLVGNTVKLQLKYMKNKPNFLYSRNSQQVEDAPNLATELNDFISKKIFITCEKSMK